MDEYTKQLEALFENVIENLRENYDGCEIFENEEHHPIAEIEDILADIEAQMLGAKSGHLVYYFLEKLVDMNCFCYRVYAFDRETERYEYWNSLEQSYQSFINANKNSHVEHYQQDTPFPTTDMLKNRFIQLIDVDKLYQN